MNTDLKAYQDLVETGFIGALKNDVLMEAEDDVAYLSSIRERFIGASTEATDKATECAAKLVKELIEAGMCQLAVWTSDDYQIIEKSSEALIKLIDKYKDPDEFPCDYFLIATEKGRDWVRRYLELLKEL